MKSIVCEVPDELHTQVKLRAITLGMTMKEYILDLILHEMNDKEKE